MAIHLRPSAPIAADALLPGDPGRALLLAQELMVQPLMSNHHRGLWGYYGETHDGMPLTVQSTGVGGPSAAIVVQELIELGVRRAVRVGTCGALDPALELGSVVIAESALADDGASRALGSEGLVEADRELTAALLAGAGGSATSGPVATTDLFYEPEPGPRGRWSDAGCVAVEMEAATVLTLGARLGAKTACALIVSDVGPAQARERIADEALQERAKWLGKVAVGALREASSSS